MRAFTLVLLLCVPLALAPRAHGQPMMLDPSQMSGIPRPDPQVPANTITVRLIKGELSNRITNTAVELTDASGKKIEGKTDAEGRATFSNLAGGPYIARAKQGDSALESQPITLPPQVGVRVMLVFPKNDQAGQPVDGLPHVDKALAPNTLVVRAVDVDGAPLVGVEALLVKAIAGERAPQPFPTKTTDAKGEATFTGIEAQANSGFLAEIIKDGTHYPSKPFKVAANAGMRVGIEVRPVSKDLQQLRFANGSYLEMRVADDAVEIFELLRLENTGTQPIDPGVLKIPLPNGAVSAQVGARAGLAIEGTNATLKGTIPPGVTELQIAFVLAYKGGSLDVTQTTPLAFEDLTVVTDEIDGLTAEGDGFVSEQRESKGHKFRLYRGRGAAAGGELHVGFRGLPHSDPTYRLIASGVSILIVVLFFAYAFGGGKQAASLRQRLLDEREQLLNELLALEVKEGEKAQRRREDVRGRLLQVYRKLDEVNA